MLVRTKICGITSVEDGLAAALAGVDAIGLNFYAKSPRFVDIPLAADIANSVGPFVSVVALVVDPNEEQMAEILDNVPVQLIQFHGDEPPEYCELWKRPYIKALRMRPELDVIEEMSRYSSSQGILLDAYHPKVPGGTGQQFDWGRVPIDPVHPIILAGGLNSNNVNQAIIATSPYGVDVCGGVEDAPGKKNHQAMADFVAAVRMGASER